MLASMIYRHDLDPFLVQFWDGVGIRWYGLAYLLGFIIGYFLFLRYFADERFTLTDSHPGDLLLTVAFSGVIGGRVGYVLLYGLEFWFHDPFYVFKIWQGGMSIHGGVAGAVLGLAWFSYGENLGFLKLTDAAAFCTPPGLFLGRIANFINGELWGRPTEGDWGVIFPAAGDSLPRHPSQLYEAVLEGPLLMGLLVWIYSVSEKDGYLSAGFMIGYGVFRFLVEFYRAPDPHLGYELFGMTRGQEYSVLFILVGLIVLPGIRNRLSTYLYDAVVWTWK